MMRVLSELEEQTTPLLLAWLAQARQPTDLGDGRIVEARIEQVLEHPEWMNPADQLLRHALKLEAVHDPRRPFPPLTTTDEGDE